MEKTLFNEEIKNIFNSNYKDALFLESLKYKKELTLAEAVHVLASCDEQVLNEAIFSKMGGVIDKALETIGNKFIGAKDAIVNWAITTFGSQVQKKDQPTPFDGAKTIVPIAQLAKKDPEGFFQKVATMTGNTASGIKALYMKLEGLYEKIPLVGKIASKIPKGWRTVIIALIVVVVAGAVIWKEKTGAGGAPKAPEVAPKAPEVAPKAPEVAPKAPEVAPKAPEVAPKAPEATHTTVVDQTFSPSGEVSSIMNKIANDIATDPSHAMLSGAAATRSAALNALQRIGAAAQSDDLNAIKSAIKSAASTFKLHPGNADDDKIIKQLVGFAKLARGK